MIQWFIIKIYYILLTCSALGLSYLQDISSLLSPPQGLSTVTSPPRSYLRTECPAQLILISCTWLGNFLA